MTSLIYRDWVPDFSEQRVQTFASNTAGSSRAQNRERLQNLARENRQIHERDCFNLNPATNVMNPLAEALLASGLGCRPSLGYPGDKYETGLEAIEEIEVITAELAAEVFACGYAEVRVASGALANLYAFMACCKPGDTIIAPPPAIGGHVTHHDAGCAGLYGLKIHHAPVHADGYTVDLDGLRTLANETRPRLITIGGSLNLFPHPVAEVAEIARGCGAYLLFDAAHQCGIIAGKAWPDPLAQGADLMTMSTYKSLGGPAGGLIVSNHAELMQRIDAIAFPGLTANFDAAKTAALGITLLDWQAHGQDYAREMVASAKTLASELHQQGLPIFASAQGFTQSHQFAIEAAEFGGGQKASAHLRQAGFLACGIGLPIAPVEGDLNGLRLGTPEIVRWGMRSEHMPQLADLIARALKASDPAQMAAETRAFRQQFDTIGYVES